MKNKKFSLWLRKVPILLVALILLFSPLMISVQARADVLHGVPSQYFVFDDGETIMKIRFPSGFYFKYFILFDTSSFDDKLLLVGSPYGTRVSYLPSASDVFSIRYAGVNVQNSMSYYVETYTFTVTGVDESSGIIDGVWSEPVLVEKLYDVSVDIVDYVYPSPDVRLRGDFSPFLLHGSVSSLYGGGILDVFSGVCSWLSGAVQNISTMFWSVESGMSVLGYLAVASLALAVILLIFYLIAGWLKFH